MKRTTKRTINIDRALRDPQLLGAALGDLDSWAAWQSILKATFALPMDEQERELFASLAGGRAPPGQRVSELWCVVGRRGGKSRMAAAVAVYLACCTPRGRMTVGEIGEVAIIAASREQANVVFNYIIGFLESSPVLKHEIESVTRTEVRLRGDIMLSTRAGSFRTLRGRTLKAAILDEVGFMRDETSAYPDLETYRAVLPALSTTNGLLIGISTPYRRIGLLYQKHRDHFGQDDANVLVVSGTSEQFNPTLNASVIERARASDPEAARAEWDAEFRNDLSSFLDDATIEAAVDHSRPLEIPPQPRRKYIGFVDPSGGRHDAFTMCIGHREGDGFIADVIRGIRPPFDPEQVVSMYATLLKDYRLSAVYGDNYSAQWVAGAFKAQGIKYIAAEKAKSQLYLETLPLFTRGLIFFPEVPQLLKELRLLERQTHRSGKDSVDHGKYGTDDYANALCGAAAHGAQRGVYDSSLDWVTGDDDGVAAAGMGLRFVPWTLRQ